MTATHVKAVVDLDPKDVRALLDAGRIFLVDVREPAEYAAERIHGALLYPLSTFDAATLPADDTRELVFYCGSGKRSLEAARRRLASGASAARHMTGGISGWRGAGLATIRIDPATGRVIDVNHV